MIKHGKALTPPLVTMSMLEVSPSFAAAILVRCHPVMFLDVVFGFSKKMDLELFGVEGLIAIVVLLVSVIFLILRRKSGLSRSEIVIVGPCGAGKTLLFCQLSSGVFTDTQTSLEENEGQVTSSKNKVCLLYSQF